jgi:hypothetical protein
MQMDDMILVSIDDHMIEPPDLFTNHVPDKWRDEMPKVVRNDQGVDEWVFQGRGPRPARRRHRRPAAEQGFNPRTELRPGYRRTGGGT